MNPAPNTASVIPRLAWAERFMNALTYPQKFTIISAVFVLPIALMIYFYNAEMGQRIDFAAKESIGLQYIRPLHQLMTQSTEAQLAAVDFGQKSEAARPALIRHLQSVQEAIAQLHKTNAQSSSKLETERLHGILSQNWDYLRQQITTSRVQEPLALFAELSTDTRNLIAHVANRSNLILDPSSNSYYLMDATCLKWPALHEILTKTWLMNHSALLRREITAEEKAELTAQLGVLRSLRYELQQGLQFSFDNDPTRRVQPQLLAPLKECLQALENYDSFCQQELLQPPRPKVTVNDLALPARRAVTASADLWKQSAAVLEELLQMRQDQYRHQQQIVWIAVSLLLIIAAILFSGFYSAVMRTVRDIQSAVQQMQQGNYHTQLTVQTRDELGKVVTSFNSVLDRLHDEYLQVKEESARAAEAQHQARENEIRFRGIFENALEGMFQTSLDGRYLAANLALARLYGYDSAEELMKSIDDISHGIYVDKARRATFIRELDQHGFLKDFISEIYRRDRTKIWISENARLVRDQQGQPVCYEGSVTDVTFRQQIEQTRRDVELEMRRAKEYAERASRAKSDFLANMSHELRTPLNGILGYTQILKRNAGLPEKAAAGLNIIHQSSEHLLTLINDILDLSKIEADKIELALSEFDLRSFLQAITGMFHLRAQQKRIAFHEHFDVTLPNVVRADEKRLRQIIINLIGNAVKFTDRGGVTFRVEKLENRLRFFFEDTGIGIADEKIDLLFKPFSQVSDQARNAEGTGLGLALSQRLVNLMGGTISVQSEYGKGSRFSFEIELETADVNLPTLRAKPREITGYHGPRQTVLAVDDKWENRAVLVDMLTPLGFAVVEAENGKVALDILATTPVQIILTDLVMPVMDGFELTRQVRKEEKWKDLVIVTISASVFDFNAEKSRAAGCQDFLGKPVDLNELLACIKTYLRLEWVYQEERTTEPILDATTTAAPLPQAEESFALPPLPAEVAGRLLDFAKKGDVQNLRQEIDQLALHNPDYRPWQKQLLILIENFKMKQIRQLIEAHSLPS